MTAAVFADSSALVKLYADEADAVTVRSLPLLVISQLARVEVPAAVWRKQRMNEIDAAEAAVLIAEFEADFFGTTEQSPRFVVVTLNPKLLDHAARLIGIHGLRAYDAVQLASAVATSGVSTDPIGFAAFDKALCSAAAAEGLDLTIPG